MRLVACGLWLGYGPEFQSKVTQSQKHKPFGNLRLRISKSLEIRPPEFPRIRILSLEITEAGADMGNSAHIVAHMVAHISAHILKNLIKPMKNNGF